MAVGLDARPEANELLVSVAEQLKVPLAIIARQAELRELTGSESSMDVAIIAAQADAALILVDSYLLGLELLQSQTRLELEPVSVSSMLVDAAHELHGFARQYGITVEMETAGRYGPVMSNPRGLKAALLSLGFALIEAQAAAAEDVPHKVVLATHRTPHGIITGIYGSQSVTMDAWRRALTLCGKASQPLTGLSSGSSAGLFVADAILRSMDSRLRPGRYLRRGGLAATLQPSRQLQLV